MDIIYGFHPALEAIANSPNIIDKIYISARKKEGPLAELLKMAAKQSLYIEIKDRKFLDLMTDGQPHQGVICICKPYRYLDIEELFKNHCADSNRSLILILDSIMDPQNLGSLIRTSLCLGVDGIVIPERRSAPITPSVVKVAAGATSHMPVARVVNIAKTIDYLKTKGYWIYGTEVAGGTPLYNQSYEGHVALVLGNEDKGIRPLVSKKCDYMITLPMEGAIDSLNVAMAGGIVLYELYRQRRMSEHNQL